MQEQTIANLRTTFEEYANKKDSIEFWFARDLQLLLGYTEWRKFLGVIDKAKKACEKSKQNINDHFVGVDKSIPMPKSATRLIADFILTRYACYLIAQNGDPRKKLISSEIELSKLIYERGVDEKGFSRIRSQGDQAL